MKQSVCLVIPPSPFLLDERVFVSLGVLKVASALIAEGFPVEVLDLSGISNFEDAVRVHASSSPASVFGVTATTPQMPAAKKIFDVVHGVRPDIKTVLGGPHPTLVLAAKKRETSQGRQARGHMALEALVKDWDVLVAG